MEVSYSYCSKILYFCAYRESVLGAILDTQWTFNQETDILFWNIYLLSSLISSSAFSLSVFLISYLDVEPPGLGVHISYFCSSYFSFLWLFALPSGRVSQLCLPTFLLSFFLIVLVFFYFQEILFFIVVIVL